MFPLCELFTHAEAARPKPAPKKVLELRNSDRQARYGNVTLYPEVVRQEPIDPLEEDPAIVAAISNVSGDGLGLVHSDPMEAGSIFEIDWQVGNESVTLRFEVVHSRPVTPGMFRTGARSLSGTIPSADASRPRPALGHSDEQAGAAAATTALAETIAGTTPCGFDRELEISQSDGHIHLHIRTPAQQNGWGIQISAAEFDAALARLRAADGKARVRNRAA